MKKLLLLYALLSIACFANAQENGGEFKTDVNVGYAKPTEGFGVKPGVVFVLEPHIYLSNYFAIGLRLEGAFLGYQARYDDEYFSFFGSTVLTGDYYFSTGTFKPFLGFGAGLFTRHYILEDSTGEDLYTSEYGSIKLGFLGRAGFEIGHARLTATYNVIGANFSYAAFTLGYSF